MDSRFSALLTTAIKDCTRPPLSIVICASTERIGCGRSIVLLKAAERVYKISRDCKSICVYTRGKGRSLAIGIATERSARALSRSTSGMCTSLGGDFECSQCGEKLTTKQGLQMHEKTHDPNREVFECDICGRRLSREDHLATHKREMHKSGKSIHAPSAERNTNGSTTWNTTTRSVLGGRRRRSNARFVERL